MFKPPAPPFVAARWHGGAQTPRRIVMHSTVSPCVPGGEKNIAHFFATESTPTSAHYCVSPSGVVQMVGDHTVAYHCGYNQDSIGIELCDMPDANNIERWKDANHQAMLEHAVDLVARLCLAYSIRPWFVGVVGLKLGRGGVTTHANMSDAFKQSTHWDPGAWPRKTFMKAVRARMKEIQAGERKKAKK